MSMNLLTVPQGKSRRELENTTQERRSIQLDGAVRKKQAELRKLEEDSLLMMGTMTARHEEEEARLKERVHALTAEVLLLEMRKEEALVPLDEMRREIETRESEVAVRETDVAHAEAGSERMAEHLTDRLDDVSDREQTVLDTQKSLQTRNSNITIQEQELKRRQEGFIEILRKYHEQKILDENDLATRQAIANGKDIVLAERERKVAQKEQGFASREKALDDKRATLEAAVREMKLKYGDQLNL